MTTVTLSPTICPSRRHCLTLQNSEEKKSIINTAFAIAMYYIPFHLRSSVSQENLRGLPKQYLIPPQQPSHLFTTVAKLCSNMELDNAFFFKGLPNRVNLNSHNAQAVFMNVAKETFADGTKNWGRVLAIYTLAGCMSLHFLLQNELVIVKSIPYWVKEFVSIHLADWIEKQGGWDDLPKKLSDDSNNQSSWSKVIAVGGVVAATAGLFLFSTGMR
ncbi:apoptosis regulator BAX [Hydra vulgaris]|uniref:Apoptosis regulator BAX n=1 Tax=Hydra vulgaris TaxID=6087 RepID=A0ABM4DIS7_HYDVU